MSAARNKPHTPGAYGSENSATPRREPRVASAAGRGISGRSAGGAGAHAGAGRPLTEHAHQLPTESGVPLVGAIAILSAALFTGAMLSTINGEIGLPFVLCFAAGSVAVTALVRARWLYTVVCLIPLWFAVAIVASSWSLTHNPAVGDNTSATVSRTEVVTSLFPLAQYFPWLAAVTGLSIIIAIGRVSAAKRRYTREAQRQELDRKAATAANRRNLETSMQARHNTRRLSVAELLERAAREREGADIAEAEALAHQQPTLFGEAIEPSAPGQPGTPADAVQAPAPSRRPRPSVTVRSTDGAATGSNRAQHNPRKREGNGAVTGAGHSANSSRSKAVPSEPEDYPAIPAQDMPRSAVPRSRNAAASRHQQRHPQNPESAAADAGTSAQRYGVSHTDLETTSGRVPNPHLRAGQPAQQWRAGQPRSGRSSSEPRLADLVRRTPPRVNPARSADVRPIDSREPSHAARAKDGTDRTQPRSRQAGAEQARSGQAGSDRARSGQAASEQARNQQSRAAKPRTPHSRNRLSGLDDDLYFDN